jgi:hypothetical protein
MNRGLLDDRRSSTAKGVLIEQRNEAHILASEVRGPQDLPQPLFSPSKRHNNAHLPLPTSEQTRLNPLLEVVVLPRHPRHRRTLPNPILGQSIRSTDAELAHLILPETCRLPVLDPDHVPLSVRRRSTWSCCFARMITNRGSSCFGNRVGSW